MDSIRQKVTNIPITDIKIPEIFRKTKPRKDKLQKVRDYYDEWGKLDKPIIIDKDYMLIDGYIRYIIAMEKHLSTVPVIHDFDMVNTSDLDRALVSLKQTNEYYEKYKDHIKNKEWEYIKGVFISNTSLFPKEYTWCNDKWLLIDVGDIIRVKVMVNGKQTTGVVRVTGKFWSDNESEHKSVIKVVSSKGDDINGKI